MRDLILIRLAFSNTMLIYIENLCVYAITTFWLFSIQVITTNVMSLNPAHGKVYLIQHVIKFVSVLRQVDGFLWFPPVTACHEINEILLKMEWNPIALTLQFRWIHVLVFRQKWLVSEEHFEEVSSRNGPKPWFHVISL